MAGSPLITLGSWRFTTQDVRRTVEVLREVMGHAQHTRPPGLFDELHNRAEILRQRAPDLSLEHCIGDAWDLLTGIRTVVQDAGLLPEASRGAVAGIFTSDGGVPKTATASAVVSWTGLEGDRQATRRHHGRPWQALCLWSSEVVEAFAADGHPIEQGHAGENVSLRGVPWTKVKPGVRLRIGSVLCEVSAYAIPCRKNAQWFVDRRFDTMHHRHGPVSRVYATVLEPGAVAVGDTVVLEP